jgi:hypothetical protein
MKKRSCPPPAAVSIESDSFLLEKNFSECRGRPTCIWPVESFHFAVHRKLVRPTVNCVELDPLLSYNGIQDHLGPALEEAKLTT